MSLPERAAQFAPFAALTGYEEAVREEGRYTAHRRELSEEEEQRLNEDWQCLQVLLCRALQGGEELPCVELTYFVPDLYKEGGAYRTEEVVVVQIDQLDGEVRLDDGRRIRLRDVISLRSRTGETVEFFEEVFYMDEEIFYNTDGEE